MTDPSFVVELCITLCSEGDGSYHYAFAYAANSKSRLV